MIHEHCLAPFFSSNGVTMKVLVTGAAGFIGSNLVLRLLERGDTVIGIDNHNDYYDPVIKEARLTRFASHHDYTHLRIDLADRKSIEDCFATYRPQRVVNLAAQDGVEHLVYASSSSVYGANTTMPFSVHHNVDHPLSLYAASKKSNELMAHSYSHLYGLPTTGLRFFTVYGPWGRPDMALFKFTKAMLEDKPFEVFNYGKHRRDFTYIDDIVEGVIRILDRPAPSNQAWIGDKPDPGTSQSPWRVYNIGNNKPIELMDYIGAIENALGKKAKMEMLPLQPGDVLNTFADINDLEEQFDYKPATPVEEGVANFVKWYREYFKC